MRNIWLKKQSFCDGLLVLFCGIILCFMGFYNTFPYVYSDCGTYIGSGFSLIVPADRPIFYGLFVRHISLLTSLWLVILVQGLIVSLTLFYYFKYLSGTKMFRYYYIAFIILITFFTSASFYVSQLMPDVFTSVTILSMGLLLLARDMKTRDMIITSCFLIISVSVHNSHYFISIFLLFIFTILFIIVKLRKKLYDLYITTGRLIYTWIIIILTFLMVCSVHSILGGGFALSKGGQVFLLTRLYDMGLLKPYLDENCGKHHFMICEYKDKLPFSLLWDYSSPLYKNGGWNTPQNRNEIDAIIKDMLTSPKYGHLYIVKATEAAVNQFFSFSLTEPTPQREDSPSYSAISVHFPAYIKTMQCSLQWNQYLGFTMMFPFINEFQKFITGICLLFYLACLVSLIKFKRLKGVMLFILTGLFINAFVCGAFSTIDVRYQCRIIWLLPLPLFLILANKEFLLEKLRKIFSDK